MRKPLYFFGLASAVLFTGQFQVPDDSSLKLCSSPLMVDVV